MKHFVEFEYMHKEATWEEGHQTMRMWLRADRVISVAPHPRHAHWTNVATGDVLWPVRGDAREVAMQIDSILEAA